MIQKQLSFLRVTAIFTLCSLFIPGMATRTLAGEQNTGEGEIIFDAAKITGRIILLNEGEIKC